MNINIEKISKYGIKLKNSLDNNNMKKSKDYFNHIKFHSQTGGFNQPPEIKNTITTFENIIDTLKRNPEKYNIESINNNLELKKKN